MDCNEILPSFLYLGSKRAALNYEGLKSIGITHIVNLAGPVAFAHDFVYMLHHIQDSTVPLFPDLLEVFRFIDEAADNGSRVLVHCLQGMSRSAAVVIAYLIYRNKMTYLEAF